VINRSFVLFTAVNCIVFLSGQLCAQETLTKPPAAKPVSGKPVKPAPVQKIDVVPAKKAAEAQKSVVLRTQNLLPATTKAWISIPDATDLSDRFERSQIGELAKKKVLKPFADSIKSQVKEWIDQQNVRLNLDIDQLDGVNSGEICFAGVLREGGEHGVVFLMDVSNTRNKAENLSDRLSKKLIARGATKKEGSIQGVIYAQHTLDKPKVERIQAVETLAAQKSFMSVMNQTESEFKSQIRWFVDPFGYHELAQRVRDSEAIGKVPRDDLAKKLAGSGFDTFRGIGGQIGIMTGEHEVLHRTFVYADRLNAGQKKVFELLDFNTNRDQPHTFPRWVPEDASSVMIGDWNMQKALKAFGHFWDAQTKPGSWKQGTVSLSFQRRNDRLGPRVNESSSVRRLKANQNLFLITLVGPTPMLASSKSVVINSSKLIQLVNPKKD